MKCGDARRRALLYNHIRLVKIRLMFTRAAITAQSRRRNNARRSMSEYTVARALGDEPLAAAPCTEPHAVVARRTASRVSSREPHAPPRVPSHKPRAAPRSKPRAARRPARRATNRAVESPRPSHDKPRNTPRTAAAAPSITRTHNEQRALRTYFVRTSEVKIYMVYVIRPVVYAV
jgi:hypothetical protein